MCSYKVWLINFCRLLCVCVGVKLMCSSVKHRRTGRLFRTHTLTHRRSVQRPARLPLIRFRSSWCRELGEKERTTWHDLNMSRPTPLWKSACERSKKILVANYGGREREREKWISKNFCRCEVLVQHSPSHTWKIYFVFNILSILLISRINRFIFHKSV